MLFFGKKSSFRLGLDPNDVSIKGALLADAWTGSFSNSRGFDVRRPGWWSFFLHHFQHRTHKCVCVCQWCILWGEYSFFNIRNTQTVGNQLSWAPTPNIWYLLCEFHVSLFLCLVGRKILWAGLSSFPPMDSPPRVWIRGGGPHMGNLSIKFTGRTDNTCVLLICEVFLRVIFGKDLVIGRHCFT